METIAYRFIENKTAWGTGPWLDEPDKVQWPDAATGLPCLAVRHPDLGHWCGYVGVGPDHPTYGRHYDDVMAEAHGGLTYGAFCADDDKEQGICHVAGDGDFDPAWWLGFDCAHVGDLSPGSSSGFRLALFPTRTPDAYRTLAFVKAECATLAAQLQEMTA